MRRLSLRHTTFSSLQERKQLLSSDRFAFTQQGMRYIAPGESIAIRPCTEQDDTV